MFLLRKLRLRTFGIIAVMLAAFAVMMSIFASGSHGDDDIVVAKRQSEDAAAAATLPTGDIINSQTLSPVM